MKKRNIKRIILIVCLIIITVLTAFMYIRHKEKKFVPMIEVKIDDISNDSIESKHSFLPIQKEDEGLYKNNHIISYVSDESDPKYDKSNGYATGNVTDTFVISDYKNESFSFCVESIQVNFHFCNIKGQATKLAGSNEYIFKEELDNSIPELAKKESALCKLGITKVKTENGTKFDFEDKGGNCWTYCGARASIGGIDFSGDTKTAITVNPGSFCLDNE